jgi:hypothetical protein
MDKRDILNFAIFLCIGIAVGYNITSSIYQPQLEGMHSSLISTQAMLSGWKENNQTIASESWFFISVAPYQNETHRCYYHTLGCEAELKNALVYYRIEEVDGTFIIQGEGNTGINGFLDLYLPLNKTYRISFNVKGLEGEVTITTSPESPSCITTLQVG